MNILNRLEFWLISGFVLVFLFILPLVPVIDGDTFWYFGRARSILETGHLFNPSVLTTKPILGMWAMALSLKVFGINLFGIYFWHTLFAAGTLWLTYVFCKNHFDQKTALYSTAVLMTALMFFYQTASPMLDIPMLLFLLLGQILALKYLKTLQPKYIYGLGAVSGLAFLTKGLLPAALPFITAFVYLCASYRDKKIFPKINLLMLFGQLFVAGLIFLLVCSIWLIPQIKHHGAEKFGTAMFQENIVRFFQPIDKTGGYREVSSDRQVDPHLNILYLWLGFLPWSPLIIPAVHAAYKNKYWQKKPEIVFMLCWFLLVLLLTSISGHYKGPRYLLPLFHHWQYCAAFFWHKAMAKIIRV